MNSDPLFSYKIRNMFSSNSDYSDPLSSYQKRILLVSLLIISIVLLYQTQKCINHYHLLHVCITMHNNHGEAPRYSTIGTLQLCLRAET